MSLFLCPICGAPLVRTERQYRCNAGHSFDLAKEGYVHLLPVSKRRVVMSGDNREMVRARTEFLESGAYAHLASLLATQICSCAKVGGTLTVLDSGCGEGYYTNAVSNKLKNNGTHVNIYGIDISKEALKRAAKRMPDGKFAVASAYHLPMVDDAVDVILNCFSPMSAPEFLRILKPGGILYYVVPAARHLWQLKEVLYETPYLNPEKVVDYPGFTHVQVLHTEAKRAFIGVDSIRALYAMTPYAYRTPRAGYERMLALETLVCTCAFDVHVYRSEKNEKK